MIYTHKEKRWTRTPAGNGRHNIAREDGSTAGRVQFLDAGTWQNTPGDDPANVDRPRVIQTEGEPLPQWALDWLTDANRRQCEKAREAFRAMLQDADDNDPTWRDTGW